MSQPSAAGLAVLVGVFVAVQAVILGILERHQGPLAAATWVYASGAVVGVAVLVAARAGWGWHGAGTLGWALVAGVCGVGIVAGIAAVVAPLGLGTTLVIITATQLVLGLALDAVGATGRVVPLTAPRVLGVLLVTVGAVLMFLRTPPAP